MGTDDLVTWLREQLDEDERVARAAIQGPWRTGAIAEHLVDHVIYGRSPFAHGGPGGDKIVQVANLEMAWQKGANAEHIARWDPARVLQEIDAKRRILDLADSAAQHEAQNADDPVRRLEKALAKVTVPAFGRVLRLLALPYANRPGYRQEWAPGDG